MPHRSFAPRLSLSLVALAAAPLGCSGRGDLGELAATDDDRAPLLGSFVADGVGVIVFRDDGRYSASFCWVEGNPRCEEARSVRVAGTFVERLGTLELTEPADVVVPEELAGRPRPAGTLGLSRDDDGISLVGVETWRFAPAEEPACVYLDDCTTQGTPGCDLPGEVCDCWGYVCRLESEARAEDEAACAALGGVCRYPPESWCDPDARITDEMCDCCP
jgi:hypothetical protein